MIDSDGRLWWTTAQAVAQLRVDRKRINDWVRRGLVSSPVRSGLYAAYLADELLAVEAMTRRAARGNKRAA